MTRELVERAFPGSWTEPGRLHAIDGEIAELHKELGFYGHRPSRFDWDAVHDELGDVLFTIYAYCDYKGIEPMSLYNRTVEKLEARCPKPAGES